MKLNTQQEQAANHIDGPCLVIAVPGSGKTRLLVERVGRMIERGIKPHHIVCVTFTNKAADEMKERVIKRLGIPKPACFVGTFHKLCVGLLRKFGEKIGYTAKYTIIDSDDQKDMIRQIARQLEIQIEKNEIPILCKAVNDYRENIWDRERLDDACGGNADWVNVIDTYLERLKNSDMIDFSGLLSETIRLLEENNDILKRVQEVFKYVQVDEVQDTNFAQFHLINLFTAKWNNVMMVGDISQSIYRFRGARYKNIQDFLKQHPDCITIELSLNYRSTPQIIKAADTLIRHNTSHMAEKFETNNPNGEPVRVVPADNQFAEADFVAKHCKRLITDGKWNPKEIAILYRMNSMSEPLERAMANLGVQYEVIGGHSFYERKEIKDCLAMLRFQCNAKDGIAFHRVAGLLEGVGETTIGRIEKMAVEENITLLDATSRYMESAKLAKIKTGLQDLISRFTFDASGMNVRDVLERCLQKFDYEEVLKKQYGEDDSVDRIDNVRQMLNSCGQFAADNPTNSIEGYLQMVTLLSSNDKKNEGDRVTLMSLHAAKGLEFPIVFMIGVEHNILPHGLSITEEPFEGMEEERRLCYVGMTRAKSQLLMSFCRNRRVFGAGGMTYHKKAKPSQFLIEAGLVKEHEAMRL